MKMQKLSMAAAIGTALFSASTFAAVTSTATPLGSGATDMFPGTPILQTTATPAANSAASSQGGGNAVSITFRAPVGGFKLDKLSFVAAGGAGASVQIYRVPQAGDALGAGSQGGTEADGFVNYAFSPAGLLNGGTPLPFSFDGTATQTLLTLDLTGTDEVNLVGGAVYGIDFTNTGNFFVRRGAAFYTGDSNIYQGDAAGTSRNDVANGRRDAPLALYAVPEPATLGALSLAATALIRRRRA
jgi:hypothetical protein